MLRGGKINPRLAERNKKIIALYLAGKTLQEVAAVYGLSGEMVRHILVDYKIEKRHTKSEVLKNRSRQLYMAGYNRPEIKKVLGTLVKFSVTPAQKKQHRIARFWKSINKKGINECWEWQACRLPGGYGRYLWDGKTQYTHIISLEIKLGRKVKLNALHTCDNPPCCNPNHLYEGTMADNARDRDERGRAGWQKDYEGFKRKILYNRKGKRTSSNLTDTEAKEIRMRYLNGESSLELAKEFSIGRSAVHRIGRYETFKDI
jgi:hypothetical protein